MFARPRLVTLALGLAALLPGAASAATAIAIRQGRA